MRSRRQPVFAGDFPDNGETVTEVMARADYDGRTYQFTGASGAGLPDGDVFRETGNPPGSGYFSGIGSATTWHPGQYPPAFAPPRAQHAAPARQHYASEVIALDMAPAWSRLFEIRCAYPAADSATPIPCGAVHRDPAAPTFRALRASAYAAGWHLDALRRWACPRCCQDSGQYRTLYPVTVYDIQAAEAHLTRDPRGTVTAWLDRDGSPPDSEYARWVAAAGVEAAARAAAEHDLFRDVHAGARHGRHAGAAR